MKHLLLAASMIAATPALAFDITNMTDAEREAFRSEMRDYLIEDPQVLAEAIDALQTWQMEQAENEARAALSARQDDLLNDGYSHVGGNPDGDVTIVEFIDYQCGWCKRAHEDVMATLEDDGNIRLVLKEFPQLGDASVEAARIALAVQEIGGGEAYASFNDILMRAQGRLSEEALDAAITEAGLDPAEIKERAKSDEIATRLNKNMDLAAALGLQGTPQFVIGDQIFRGYIPQDRIEEAVADARS
ncbi:thioredoxin domain-containing protein [Paracoccaceae bacterium GXU_MW_L88]